MERHCWRTGPRSSSSSTELEQHSKNAFPTDAVYGPTPDATLRLITCGGSYDASAGHYRDNTIAFAHLKS
jgi:hypothetical protein